MSGTSQVTSQSAAPSARTPSASETDAPPKSRSARTALLLGVLLLALAAGLYFALRGGGSAPSDPSADVPRLVDGQIVFSQAFRERNKLKTEPVKPAPLTPTIAAVGMVTFDPRHTARVGTRLRGVVRSLSVYEGDEVKRDQVLAEINSPELGDAQAQVAMLTAQAQVATRQAERESRLAADNLSTARAAEEAMAARAQYQSMLRAAEQRVAALSGGKPVKVDSDERLGVHTLTAPIAGTIVERHIAQGELVEGDRTAFLIAELNHLWIELDVFERNLASIRVGDRVLVHPLSGAGGELQGRVAQVGAVIDTDTRSAPVRIEVDNSKRLLRPGQAVDAQIEASQVATTDALLVPLGAITYVDGEPTVFVATTPLTVVPTRVEVGDSNGTERQVLAGLKAGQEVVVQGVFELKSELFR